MTALNVLITLIVTTVDVVSVSDTTVDVVVPNTMERVIIDVSLDVTDQQIMIVKHVSTMHHR
jgi:hypothetical protein